MRADFWIGAIAALGITPAWAESATLQQAIDATRPIVNLRLRSERVDQTGIAENATAVTLRARLGFETGQFWKTTLLAEGVLLWPLDTDYNSTVNGKARFPVVADPEIYGLNRLQLTNTSLPGTTIALGRQRLTLDDHRFIGDSGWRQNEQTFDALRITNKSVDKLALDFAYIEQVNRVFGADSPVGRYRGDSWLANVAYQFPAGKLSSFIYLLDFKQAPSDSSRTYGLRFAGERPLHGITIAYSATYASQQNYARNPLRYRDGYYALELGATWRQLTLAAGMETLEGDGAKGFTTPLATLHKFQGWADKFLTTPPNGIDDRYVTLTYAKKPLGIFDGLTASASYHRFSSERLSINYGFESDFQVQLKMKQFAAVLKYADYVANGFATDTRKLWLQMEYVR
jgi:hypothetical protein